MGLFYNYNKPGKGITREEAERRNYFEILWRKLSKIVTVNLLYLGCNIIFFGAAVFMIAGIFASDGNSAEELAAYFANVFSGRALLPITLFVPFMLIGPTTAGLTYVCRNFARQEHAFIASDFFEHTKKNLRQGLLASIIITLAFYLFITAVIFYYNSGINRTLVMMLSALMGYILVIASFYVYPLMVTFDLKLSVIFKNSVLLAFLNLPWNLVTLFALALVHGVLLWRLPVIWLFLMVIFLMAWSSYTINFTVWGAIDKYMMPKNNE